MRKKTSQGRSIWLTIVGLCGLGLFIATILNNKDVTLLNPKGMIANEQFNLIVFSVALMMVIAVPTLFLFYFFAWKYRETNDKAVHDTQAPHSKLLDLTLWTIPTVFVIVLAIIMWSATHRLEPQKTIAANKKPITIQVVAMRWKWLFIYPEQNIATVNFVQIPIDTPVQFDITADETPMSSFWIPHWGGQLYAMTGHLNRLNLIADAPGDYPGSSAEINGRGFAGMKFIARASSEESFDVWVEEVRKSQNTLDLATYDALVKPSENSPVKLFASYDKSLYEEVLAKYEGHAGDHSESDFEGAHH
jgi:cytochrome o ubiquinol oxidase subunit 2